MQSLGRPHAILAVVVLLSGIILVAGRCAAAHENAGIMQDQADLAPGDGTLFRDALDRHRTNPPQGFGRLKEFDTARSDHATIALNVGECYWKDIGQPPQWPRQVRIALMLDFDNRLTHRIAYASMAGSDGMDMKFVLNPFHAAAISFSDRISRDRIQFGRELEDSRDTAFWYQRGILALGALGTILISLRAMVEDNSKLSRFVGVSAIVVSAVGASMTSMNTFDNSQAVAARDQRALAQLQQLHWRIASDVLTRPELCGNPGAAPGKAMDVVDAWRVRLEMILDSAVESISKPGDLQGGGGAVPTEPGKVNHRWGRRAIPTRTS
jgi:hypothetical protein